MEARYLHSCAGCKVDANSFKTCGNELPYYICIYLYMYMYIQTAIDRCGNLTKTIGNFGNFSNFGIFGIFGNVGNFGKF